MSSEIKPDIPLAKHFIEKGKRITKDDICYLDSESGEIVNTPRTNLNSASFYSMINQSMFNQNQEALHIIINDKKFYKILYRCAIYDIEKYTPITKDMLESCEEKEAREKRQREEEHKRAVQKKIEAQIKSMKEEQQNSSSNNESFEDEIKKDAFKALKEEIENNIWL